jgi:hypothetical protein
MVLIFMGNRKKALPFLGFASATDLNASPGVFNPM